MDSYHFDKLTSKLPQFLIWTNKTKKDGNKMKEEDIVGVIREKYGKVSAKLIAEECGVSVFKVYRLARKNSIKTSKARNKTVGEMNRIQKQILISGIFGDGSYRKNGNVGFQYREQHAFGEKDYCKWKFDNLGKLTEGYNFYCRNTVNDRDLPVYGFETMTTKDLEFYSELHKNKYKAIELLDEIGFCLFILDDGWKRTNTIYLNGNLTLMLTVNQYDKELRNKIVDRFKFLFGEDSCNLQGIKREDLYIRNYASNKIAEILLELMGSGMDIIKKKIL